MLPEKDYVMYIDEYQTVNSCCTVLINESELMADLTKYLVKAEL